MGKITDHLLSLVEKQVRDKGIVVWYDPDRTYTRIAASLAVPEATVLAGLNAGSLKAADARRQIQRLEEELRQMTDRAGD